MNELTNGALTRSIPWVDRFSIGISLMCLAHCLLMPVLLVILPSTQVLLIAGENTHLWLVCMVIPSSLFALGIGCKQHSHLSFMMIGLCGLGFLILGLWVELIGLQHHWEQAFTMVGALFIAFAHVRNFQMCHRSTDCPCH